MKTALCVRACVRLGERYLSSGITLTGEKVKLADPHRQEDNLFGRETLEKKMERSLQAIQNPIRETETDREKRQ